MLRHLPAQELTILAKSQQEAPYVLYLISYFDEQTGNNLFNAYRNIETATKAYKQLTKKLEKVVDVIQSYENGTAYHKTTVFITFPRNKAESIKTEETRLEPVFVRRLKDQEWHYVECKTENGLILMVGADLMDTKIVSEKMAEISQKEYEYYQIKLGHKKIIEG